MAYPPIELLRPQPPTTRTAHRELMSFDHRPTAVGAEHLTTLGYLRERLKMIEAAVPVAALGHVKGVGTLPDLSALVP